MKYLPYFLLALASAWAACAKVAQWLGYYPNYPKAVTMADSILFKCWQILFILGMVLLIIWLAVGLID